MATSRADRTDLAAGDLYVISAPSGAGKTTLVTALVAADARLVVSTSHTTRPPRGGEIDGKDYFFIDEIKFNFRPDQIESIGSYWQLGLAIGLRDEPIKAWAFSFDRLGLTYSYSKQGELRGIEIQVRSLYDF